MFKHDLKVEELITRTKSMTDEEIDIVLDNIPIERCLARIGRELKKNKVFMESIKDVVMSG